MGKLTLVVLFSIAMIGMAAERVVLWEEYTSTG